MAFAVPDTGLARYCILPCCPSFPCILMRGTWKRGCCSKDTGRVPAKDPRAVGMQSAYWDCWPCCICVELDVERQDLEAQGPGGGGRSSRQTSNCGRDTGPAAAPALRASASSSAKWKLMAAGSAGALPLLPVLSGKLPRLRMSLSSW